MSPGALEAHGLINQSEYQKVAALTQSASPDAHKKIVGKTNNLYLAQGYFNLLTKIKYKTICIVCDHNLLYLHPLFLPIHPASLFNYEELLVHVQWVFR